MQNLRKALLIISFVLLPVTLYYFSPALIIQAAAVGILAGSGIVFLFQFLASLFLGRAFCGWLCPAGAIQEWSFNVNNKKANNKYNWVKFVIWGLWLALIIYMFIRAGGIKEVQFLYENKNGISIDASWKYIVYYIVLTLFISLSFIFGRRAFCHYSCWMSPFMILGTKIKNTFSLPSLHINVNKDECISCKKCNQVCPMSLDVESMVQKGNMDNVECILCGECIDVCPKEVLKINFAKKDR